MVSTLGGGTDEVVGPALANKLHHIFDKPSHRLAELADDFGSQVKAYRALETAAQDYARAQHLAEGEVKTVSVTVGRAAVEVTGRFVDGVFRVGSATKAQ